MVSGAGQRRVLIVDDEATITDSLVRIFAGVGFQVRGVYSAEEARAILPAWSPDIAIVDVHLPEMNGIDLAILLKAAHPACHLLLFSGFSDTGELLEQAAGKGYEFEIMAKPVHPTELLMWVADQSQPEEGPSKVH